MPNRDTNIALNKLLLWLKMQTFFFGYLLAMHRDHFITMDTIADMIVYPVAFTNLLLFRNLYTLLDIFNIALVISPHVALFLMGDLLHGLLHALVLLLGVIIAFAP